MLRVGEHQGLWELSPGGQIRLIEADGSAARATPGTVGVSGQEAVSTAWVQAAVGYWHLHHAGMGGSVQQPLHSQTRRVRSRHSVTLASDPHYSQSGERLTSSAHVLLMAMSQGSLTFYLA